MAAKRRAHRSRIRRGDLVQVISGANKGQSGRVLRVLPDDGKVVVEGVGLVHRHVRRSQKNPQGGRIRKEAAISYSNVMLLDPVENVPTKLGKRLKDPEKGSLGWVRFARRSGEELVPGSGKPAKKRKKSKE